MFTRALGAAERVLTGQFGQEKKGTLSVERLTFFSC